MAKTGKKGLRLRATSGVPRAPSDEELELLERALRSIEAGEYEGFEAIKHALRPDLSLYG